MSKEADKKRKGSPREAALSAGSEMAPDDHPIWSRGCFIGVPITKEYLERRRARAKKQQEEARQRKSRGSLPHQYPWLDDSYDGED